MKRKLSILFIVIAIVLIFVIPALAIVCPNCGAQNSDDANFCNQCGTILTNFIQDDIVGTWYGHGLAANISEVWEYYTTTIDIAGNVLENWTDSSGNSGTRNRKIVISTYGIITQVGDPSVRGVMSIDKNIIFSTGTWGTGERVLSVYVKEGATFIQDDLAGTWYGHGLAANISEVWEYYTTTIDIAGNVLENWTDSSGSTGTRNRKMVISNDGIITQVGDPSVRGVMSSDKNIIVQTGTRGTSERVLSVYVKGGATFILSDNAGTWYGHGLAANISEVWEYYTTSVTTRGDGSVTWTDSSGNSGAYTIKNLISVNGIITSPGDPNVHGVMSSDKNITVLTGTWGTGERVLTVHAKKIEPPASLVSGSGDGGGGGCFIATAAYGSRMAQEVNILKNFRDNILMTGPIGKTFVKFYYNYSPPIADFIAKHDSIKAMVCLSLLPIVGMSWVALQLGFAATVALLLVCCICLFGMISFTRKKVKS